MDKKNIVRRTSSLLLIFLLCLGLCLTGTGCSSKQKLYIFNWGDYIAPEILDMFETEYPQYEVIYDNFDTNETMYQKLVSTNTPYDVLVPSDYMIARLIEEDRLMKIDTDQLENYKNLDATLTHTDFDPDGEYSVPYLWGTLGIVYNKKLVKGPVDSWDILWDPQYKGNILMLDSVRDSMAAALIKLGHSLNTKDAAAIKAAGELLVSQKPLVAQYGVDDIKEPMINGNYALCLHYSGDALWMMQQNPDLEYAIPKEGSNIWIDSMVIPKTSKNYEGAMAFIDFMCRKDIAYLNTDYNAYSTPLTKDLIQELVDEELLDAEMAGNHVYNPPEEETAKTEAYIHLGDSLNLYNEAWEKLRLSTGEESGTIDWELVWLYGSLIVIAIILVIVFKIRKKRLDKIKYDD